MYSFYGTGKALGTGNATPQLLVGTVVLLNVYKVF